MILELQIISMAHAPIALREMVSLKDGQKLSYYTALQAQDIRNACILSTCNRCELYIGVTSPAFDLQTLASSLFPSEIAPYMNCYKGKEAMSHMLRVCVGLESVIIGEDQIHHQMKEAYAYASAAGMIQKEFHFLFQTVFSMTKQVKSTWRISEQPMTSSYIAWQLLQQTTSIPHKNILLCGAGEVIQDFLPYLYEQTDQIWITSRNLEKVEELRQKYPSLQPLSMEQRKDFLPRMDILISATAAPHVMFPYQKQVLDHELIMLDLAMPRDIDPAWAKEPWVQMYDIDQIQKTAQQAQERRSSLASQAELQVEELSERLYHQWRSQKQEPLLAAAQKQLIHMSEHTYALLEQKLQLKPHEQRMMKKTLDYAFTSYMKQLIEVVQKTKPEEKEVYLKFLKQLQKEGIQ